MFFVVRVERFFLDNKFFFLDIEYFNGGEYCLVLFLVY